MNIWGIIQADEAAYKVSVANKTTKEQGQEANKKSSESGSNNPVDESTGVGLTISDEALSLLEEYREKVSQSDGSGFQDMAQAMKTDAKEAAKEAKIRIQCMKIAIRLAAGDKVPQKDEKFLIENNPEMYNQAKAAQIMKKNPKEYKSVLDDEDDSDGDVDSSNNTGNGVSSDESAGETGTSSDSGVESVSDTMIGVTVGENIL